MFINATNLGGELTIFMIICKSSQEKSLMLDKTKSSSSKLENARKFSIDLIHIYFNDILTLSLC